MNQDTDNLESGFFGIGIMNGKTPENLGVLWRSAQNLGASFIYTIGKRYAKQASDTHNAVDSIPYFHYKTFEDFYKHLPKGAMLVGIEFVDDAQLLQDFKHPRNCVYLLGAEDHGLSNLAIEKSHHLVKFNTPRSLNVSVAGSIVMYDRSVKGFTTYIAGKPK
ncbi:RNA methyltransferase [Nonlabens ponticola]|uniref:TrmH family RNA methyltransferase n=1 Tax=Nonlabens ponticola TaxID=2496866 RepID=A0A3S9MW17_9FLAO|nr:RNA methyltransferase [Nonlabens ponticola]AZQ43332.1 TrmH family RNA methyltransferase [Nonlabens ponticola]